MDKGGGGGMNGEGDRGDWIRGVEGAGHALLIIIIIIILIIIINNHKKQLKAATRI